VLEVPPGQFVQAFGGLSCCDKTTDLYNLALEYYDKFKSGNDPSIDEILRNVSGEESKRDILESIVFDGREALDTELIEQIEGEFRRKKSARAMSLHADEEQFRKEGVVLDDGGWTTFLDIAESDLSHAPDVYFAIFNGNDGVGDIDKRRTIKALDKAFPRCRRRIYDGGEVGPDSAY